MAEGEENEATEKEVSSTGENTLTCDSVGHKDVKELTGNEHVWCDIDKPPFSEEKKLSTRGKYEQLTEINKEIEPAGIMISNEHVLQEVPNMQLTEQRNTSGRKDSGEQPAIKDDIMETGLGNKIKHSAIGRIEPEPGGKKEGQACIEEDNESRTEGTEEQHVIEKGMSEVGTENIGRCPAVKKERTEVELEDKRTWPVPSEDITEPRTDHSVIVPAIIQEIPGHTKENKIEQDVFKEEECLHVMKREQAAYGEVDVQPAFSEVDVQPVGSEEHSLCFECNVHPASGEKHTHPTEGENNIYNAVDEDIHLVGVENILHIKNVEKDVQIADGEYDDHLLGSQQQALIGGNTKPTEKDEDILLRSPSAGKELIGISRHQPSSENGSIIELTSTVLKATDNIIAELLSLRDEMGRESRKPLAHESLSLFRELSSGAEMQVAEGSYGDSNNKDGGLQHAEQIKIMIEQIKLIEDLFTQIQDRLEVDQLKDNRDCLAKGQSLSVGEDDIHKETSSEKCFGQYHAFGLNVDGVPHQ
ncbi:Hypothetical predicted protein [Pelobates cultripes]|uniref:Uncharacterized protein n=1 Tax=Pelobates cultripes TaxID=61616 RepID=A0AAD1TSG7_PELCU|nr:Hypothetical predicted protein [Pelobates cultripes]